MPNYKLILVCIATGWLLTNAADINQVNTWADNAGYFVMNGHCLLPVTESLQHFYIIVNFNQDTYGITNWIANEDSKQPKGRWYKLKNIWTIWPPELYFGFQIKYNSTQNAPTGTCAISTYTETSTTSSSSISSSTTPTTSSSTTTTLSSSTPTTPTTTSSTIKTTTGQEQTTQSTSQVSTTTSSTKSTTQSTPPVTSSQQVVSTKYDYAEVIQLSILFYEAQRSGKLSSDNRIPYRGDSALGDMGFNAEDLTGGWYDAGDHVKFNLPMSSATTVLSWGLTKWEDAYAAAGQLDFMYDSIQWPLDYLKKCWNENLFYCQVGDASSDHLYWGRPEEMTMSRPAFAVTPSKPGSEVVGETAAAFAAASIAFASRNPDYSAELLSKARTLYTFAKTYQGKYSDSIPQVNPYYTSHSGFHDELCYSAAMLYKATKEDQYKNDAATFSSTGTAWAFSWDDKNVACQLILYQETNDTQYKTPVERFLNDYIGNGVPKTGCGLSYRSQWGSNRYAANAAFIALMAADTPGFANAEQYKTYAMSQIHYMLGENNYDMSYQIGFGNNYPKQPHHRSSSCPDSPATCNNAQLTTADDNPQKLYGALVGGPDSQDNYVDYRQDYVQNEVACDYNAGFQSAAAGLLHFALQGNLPAAPSRKC